HRLPDSGLSARKQRVAAFVPVIEIADDRNLTRVWRPDGEGRADNRSLLDDGMRSQLVIQLEMIALVEQVEVLIGKHDVDLIIPARRASEVLTESLACASGWHRFHTSPTRKQGTEDLACASGWYGNVNLT